MIVTISGKPGSGKSTVAKLLAERLGFRFEDIGHRRRELARSRGLTLEELNELGEREAWTDNDVDEYQKRLGETADDLVVSGRTSFHFIPNSVKVFLDVSDEEGVRRIHADQNADRRTEDRRFTTLEDIRKSLHERMATDRRRYAQYYRLDVYDPSQYDLVVDTTNLPIRNVVDRIFAYLEKQPKRASPRPA